jgi:hypothetical protein
MQLVVLQVLRLLEVLLRLVLGLQVLLPYLLVQTSRQQLLNRLQYRLHLVLHYAIRLRHLS